MTIDAQVHRLTPDTAAGTLVWWDDAAGQVALGHVTRAWNGETVIVQDTVGVRHRLMFGRQGSHREELLRGDAWLTTQEEGRDDPR